jgi:hypothetical protein
MSRFAVYLGLFFKFKCLVISILVVKFARKFRFYGLRKAFLPKNLENGVVYFLKIPIFASLLKKRNNKLLTN